MNALNARIAALSPEKRALLERRIQSNKSDTKPDRIPKREGGEEGLPLSFAQQRLWFMEQIEPGHFLYNLMLAVRLAGPLRASKLEESINEIVRRHEALRTTFKIVDGQATQVIAPNLPLRLALNDLRTMPEAEREPEAGRLALFEANSPFDLVRGPLLRARLLHLNDFDHVLLLTMHHIVSDGWSMGVLNRELSTLYLAFCNGQPSPLPELPIQYSDFTLWQRAQLQGEVFERLLSYWKNKLAGIPVLLELPTDRPRPPLQVFQGASYSEILSESLLEGLKTIARQAEVTLFMALLAAFTLLLSRYSGQCDIAVGSPIANRTRVELEGLIGFFVNTLVLRTDLSGDPTFRELLGRVREVALAAFAHQDMPFERLVEELQPVRNLSHNPLFQVGFALQNAESGMENAPEQGPPQFRAGASKFDLTLSATETTDGLMTVFEYNTALFDAATILHMARNFQVLIESIIADPDLRISKCLMLESRERSQLIENCKGPTYDAITASCIHELCRRQAMLRPDGLAVVYGEQHLTYEGLNSKANQLARELRKQGCGPETIVGLCVERSPEMVIGLLGILKAGAAYLPLDPAHPKDRLSYMLTDSQAAMLVTQARLIDDLPACPMNILCLDSDWACIAEQDDYDLEPVAEPDNLAYIIYTSGSTGQPKGVLVPHIGVCNAAEATSRAFPIQPESRILQFSSLSFDASAFEIVMALRAGATLCLEGQESLLPGPPLAQALGDARINVLTLTPSALAVLPEAMLPDLNTLIVAGEACSMAVASRWASGRRFFNAYGPTEASIWATWTECADVNTTPLIGRSIINIQVYVADQDLEPQPVGVPGEIYIGGVGVTRGYCNRPDLTAECYLPDPFSSAPGSRIYRTGDRARRLWAGDIHFLGRVDQQLKLRGYRIEPGEIEASLLLHPAVRDAVVVAKVNAFDEARLIAYYVPPPGQAPSATELRRFLLQRLPNFMVPSGFITLDSFPLNENGKLNRMALSAIADGWSEPDDIPSRPPRTETEEILAAIWREVLEVDRIGIDDDFFSLGGHSLIATRVASRVNSSFQTDLPLRRFFELPTIVELAEAIDAAKADKSRPRLPDIIPVAREVISLPLDFESIE
jgi:amino acid adenylation domain-containing protein